MRYHLLALLAQRYAAHTDKGGEMKKWAYVLLGLFLAGMALTAASHGDLFGIAFGIVFAAGSWRSFRAAGRAAPAPSTPEGRPWER